MPERSLVQAALVDVEYDNPRVHAAGHGEGEPGVVEDVVEPGDQADIVELGDMADEQQHQREAYLDTDDLSFKAISLLGPISK